MMGYCYIIEGSANAAWHLPINGADRDRNWPLYSRHIVLETSSGRGGRRIWSVESVKG
jgi:hypothetical protein